MTKRAYRRPVALLSARQGEALQRQLQQRGWPVVRQSEKDGLEALDEARVGILDTAGLDIPKWIDLLRHSEIRWIALVPDELRNEADVRRLILDVCSDYILYPLLPEALDDALLELMATAASAKNRKLNRFEAGQSLVGSSACMTTLRESIASAAYADAPVFIYGETGTGKELVARAIHDSSPRMTAPFVVVNCAAVSQQLLCAELFGYERGAFTGAERRKLGKVELAEGGTIFLDEIGDLAPDCQAILLRFLGEGTFERLGGTEVLRTNARIISATNVDLLAAVREGRFRSDLFHRLCVMRIDVPPLRERGADITLLAEHTVKRFASEHMSRLRGFTPDALELIQGYQWPGNVRELINRVRRAIMMADGAHVRAVDLDVPRAQPSWRGPSLYEVRISAERSAIERALLANKYNYSEAARQLAISRATLYRLMQSLGLGQAAADFACEPSAEQSDVLGNNR